VPCNTSCGSINDWHCGKTNSDTWRKEGGRRGDRIAVARKNPGEGKRAHTSSTGQGGGREDARRARRLIHSFAGTTALSHCCELYAQANQVVSIIDRRRKRSKSDLERGVKE